MNVPSATWMRLPAESAKVADDVPHLASPAPVFSSVPAPVKLVP